LIVQRGHVQCSELTDVAKSKQYCFACIIYLTRTT
jgi:hypothetical protein